VLVNNASLPAVKSIIVRYGRGTVNTAGLGYFHAYETCKRAAPRRIWQVLCAFTCLWSKRTHCMIRTTAGVSLKDYKRNILVNPNLQYFNVSKLLAAVCVVTKE
jgi:hypothetical protein